MGGVDKVCILADSETNARWAASQIYYHCVIVGVDLTLDDLEIITESNLVE